MTPKTIERLQYFVGKVCSIVSTSMNRAFDERISREHFVVRVELVNADGIWGCHPYNNELISFFQLEHIISIHEEIELDPSNPEHQEMIKEYEAKTGRKQVGDLKQVPKQVPKQAPADPLQVIDYVPESPPEDGDATFVDISKLERLAEHTKKMFDAADNYVKPF